MRRTPGGGRNRAVALPESIRDALDAEARRGTRLALAGKAAIIVAMTLFLVSSYEGPSLLWPMLFVAGFTLTGAVQVWITAARPDWVAAIALIAVIDAVALAVVVSMPNPLSGFDLPPQIPLRGSFFVLLIVYIISVGYCYNPTVALAAGAGAGLSWLALTGRVSDLDETVDWSVLPTDRLPTRDELLTLYADPHFVDTAARTVEVLAMALAAVLVAGLVWRGRGQVRRILTAEAEHAAAKAEKGFVRETFGRYVPDAVVSAILADRGRLAPVAREATVLFVDIEGFTALGERVPAERLLRVLNAYFEAAGRIVTAHGGTINQFQGDAILASFNVPVADPEHAARAVCAARALCDLVAGQVFEGERLAVRIGVHTGPVVAGAVGGNDRLTYTVHGAAVNLAARLEHLNKETGTTTLISADTAERAGGEVPLRRLGPRSVRGRAVPVVLYTLAERPG